MDIEEETGRPYVTPETMETNVEGLFIAGVIAAGNNANEILLKMVVSMANVSLELLSREK